MGERALPAVQTRHRAWTRILKYKYLYILLFPAVIHYIIFAYLPIYGITLAFQDFSYRRGILGSPWVGLRHFETLFAFRGFWQVFNNTVVISVVKLITAFPVPIIIAVMLNEVRGSLSRRFYQTVYTFPHFLSWVIVSGIIFNFLSTDGVLNQTLVALGGDRVNLLTRVSAFRPMLYVTNIWKSAGWGSIIYLAAIAGINPELYEAASIDGANRYRKMLHITWPGIRSTAGILFILSVANIMNAGFDQIFNLYNPVVYDVADILDTYIYRRALMMGMDFSSATAIGLFKSVINFILLIGANLFIRVLGEEGVF
jgi:putative aldouronate transport system permease protein